MNLTQITPPAALPVSLSEAKDHCNELSNDHDSKLIGFIYAAVAAVESYLRRSLITQTWEVQLDKFHKFIYLPRGPVQSISALTYIDGAGDSQTLAASQYTLDASHEPPRIFAAYGVSYPAPRSIPAAVRVRYIAGYGSKGHQIPEPIRHAIKMIVADLFNNPESSIMDISRSENPALQMMLDPYKTHGYLTHSEA